MDSSFVFDIINIDIINSKLILHFRTIRNEVLTNLVKSFFYHCYMRNSQHY